MMAVVTNFSISGRDIRKETDNWMLNFEKQFTDLKFFFLIFQMMVLILKVEQRRKMGMTKRKRTKKTLPHLHVEPSLSWRAGCGAGSQVRWPWGSRALEGDRAPAFCML